jgi:Sulfatase
MDENPKGDQQVAREAKGELKKRGLSRRGVLNVIKHIGVGIGAAVIVGRDAIVAFAQQVTGVLGSPGATTTIPGNQLPPPPPEFGGVIKESYKDSTPWWPPRVVPPKGAPNILLIMTDDQGYGVSGTFGGVIPTPALDRIAAAGLRYTEFNSTSLCSPTRAALITGRNHHAVGFGVIAELSTGYPGYDSIIGPENATIGQILRESGYATSWFGKNHSTPGFQYSASGPFNQWPSGMGFQYFRDSWEARPISGRRICSAITPRYILGSEIPTTTSPPTSRMKRSNISRVSTPLRPTSHSSFIMFLEGATPHTSRRKSGSTSSKASSTWVGTPCAMRSSRTKSGWG